MISASRGAPSNTVDSHMLKTKDSNLWKCFSADSIGVVTGVGDSSTGLPLWSWRPLRLQLILAELLSKIPSLMAPSIPKRRANPDQNYFLQRTSPLHPDCDDFPFGDRTHHCTVIDSIDQVKTLVDGGTIGRTGTFHAATASRTRQRCGIGKPSDQACGAQLGTMPCSTIASYTTLTALQKEGRDREGLTTSLDAPVRLASEKDFPPQPTNSNVPRLPAAPFADRALS
ncbi:hypothetical protein KC333_g136 [Hortaea werneckii]|nr:hypothetical protein KC333_g136 [Hortaea werneckii]